MDSGLISLSHKPIKLCEDMPILLLTPCVCVCGFVLLQSTLSATSIKLSYYLCVSGFALHVPDCVSTLFLCSYLCSFFTVFIPPPPRSSLHHPFSTPLLPRCSNGSKPVSGQSRLQYGPNAQCLEPSLPGRLFLGPGYGSSEDWL